MNQALEDLHLQFHQALIANCASRWLRQFCASLTDEAYRFRQLAASKNYARRDEAEHIAIFEACIEGRTEDAVTLLQTHYRKTAALTQAAKAAAT